MKFLMKNLNHFRKNHSIFIELISTIFIIIDFILLTAQGFDNDSFKKSKIREAKTKNYFIIFSKKKYILIYFYLV